MKRVVLVFLKYPEAGAVKTRLASSIGEEAAALAYRQMVCRVLEQCRQANPDMIAIAHDPAERGEEIRAWLAPWLDAFPGEILWIPQFGPDFGERLGLAVESVYATAPDAQLAIVGTDCVHLDREVFEETWRRLGEGTDAVFGPTEDGGYYLLGMSAPRLSLFRGIPWSSRKTLEASLAAAETSGLSTGLLPERLDVDTESEWNRANEDVSGRRCVFFNRDGVINESPGAGYVLRWEDFRLRTGIADALCWLRQRDWLAIVVTSQKGVGKGLMTGEELERIHDNMQRELAEQGASFDGIYAYTGERDCPHQPKPDPGMIVTASESFFIDRSRSWMIGDADRDIEMGKAAGLAGTIRIRGEKEIGIEANHTLDSTNGLCGLFEKIL